MRLLGAHRAVRQASGHHAYRLRPGDLQSTYNLAAASAGNGAGVTIGIVDAFDSLRRRQTPYRAQFGLAPLDSCTPSTIRTSATPCFAKSNQTGGTTPPRKNDSWAQEESLDADMASAICPHCNIPLVEADTNSLTNLGGSVNEAVALGSAVVSNSYGGGEASGEVAEENGFYNHPGVAITASSGDQGFGAQFPAASRFVTAVGGTSLVHATNARGWSETVWNGAGSGCSAFIAKPTWQTDTGCARRTISDVSADADPNTGVAVFDSTAFQGLSGWLEFGGTSVASPIIASVYALARELLDADDPVDAFERWLRLHLEIGAYGRGLAANVMSGKLQEGTPVNPSCREMNQAGQDLLERAQSTGRIRGSVDLADLVLVVHGIVLVNQQVPTAVDRPERMLKVVTDGLRASADS